MAICWHSMAVPSPPTNAFAAGSHAMSPTATTTGSTDAPGVVTETGPARVDRFPAASNASTPYS